MKISNIKIFDYQQFKDFELDLTYPKGHEKAGQPLDKVCLIGQSGTGKTTILRIIRELIYGGKGNEDFSLASIEEVSQIYSIEEKLNDITALRFKFSYDFEYGKTRIGVNFYEKKEKIGVDTLKKKTKKVISDRECHYIYFPAEFIDRVNQFLEKEPIKNPNEYLKATNEELEKVEETNSKYGNKKHFDFESDNVLEIWKKVLKEISDYNFQKQNFAATLLDSEDEKDILKKYRQWQKNTPNPLKGLAKVLNPVLNHFQLEIETEPKFKSAEELNYIKIKSLNGQEVPRNGWSTGTKQIIDTAIPLYKLNTNETIVLFDEPERSLYPDLQQMVIPYYTNTLAPDAQFFFATHSPIIASCFEPWEIVELDFDENGYVQRKKYFDGENHVDNYVIDPRYLRWDSILEKLFDVEEGGNDEFRIPKLMELATLEKQIKTNNMSQKEKKALWQQYQKLAQLLDWKIND